MKRLKKTLYGLDFLCIFFVISFIYTICHAEENEKQVHIGKEVSFSSAILGEERTLFVYLPERYHYSKQKYPVLYLLDAEAHFHFLTGVVQFLSFNGKIPEMVVIGIVNTDRVRDFTPTHVSMRPTSGGADKFLIFLKKELIPWSEETLRTQPYRILMGHSLGGLLAIYALFTAPEMFQSYVAVSPWLIHDNEFMLKYVKDRLHGMSSLDKFLYMSVGGKEKGSLILSNQRLNQILSNRGPDDLEWNFHVADHENHGTVLLKSYYDALVTVFSEWSLPEACVNQPLAVIKALYKQVSDRYGYVEPLPEKILNTLGYRALARGEVRVAVELFTENVKLYPESANVYDSLGEAYELMGQFALARDQYKIACKLAKEASDPLLSRFKINLERVQNTILAEKRRERFSESPSWIHDLDEEREREKHERGRVR